MVTKAIVEQLIDPYHVRVRIPSLDRTLDSSVHTLTENLNIALVCTIPGCDPNIKVGDVVFVSFDDYSENQIVIIGHLYTSYKETPLCDMAMHSLIVNDKALLPYDTSVGDVTCDEIRSLQGARYSLQEQIDRLSSQLDDLSKQLVLLRDGVKTTEKEVDSDG